MAVHTCRSSATSSSCWRGCSTSTATSAASGTATSRFKSSIVLIDRQFATADRHRLRLLRPGRRHPPHQPSCQLLGATGYGVGIDRRSSGCLLDEMFFGKPLLRAMTEVSSSRRRLPPPPILVHGGEPGNRPRLCGAGAGGENLGSRRSGGWMRSIYGCQGRCATVGDGGGGAASLILVSSFSKSPLIWVVTINRDPGFYKYLPSLGRDYWSRSDYFQIGPYFMQNTP